MRYAKVCVPRLIVAAQTLVKRIMHSERESINRNSSFLRGKEKFWLVDPLIHAFYNKPLIINQKLEAGNWPITVVNFQLLTSDLWLMAYCRIANTLKWNAPFIFCPIQVPHNKRKREQRIRILTYQKLYIPQYMISDRLKFLYLYSGLIFKASFIFRYSTNYFIGC